MTTEEMITKYLLLRDKKSVIEKQQKEALAPYNVALDTLENLLLAELNKAGLRSMACPNGTAYKTTKSSAKVMDWTATLDFIKANEAWDLLDKRVSKTAVEAIIEETNQPIPGVETTREVQVNVRKA